MSKQAATQQTTDSALANDIEHVLRAFKRGDSYPYMQQMDDLFASGGVVFTINHHDLGQELYANLIDNPDDFITACKIAILSIMAEIHNEYADYLKDHLQIKIIGVDPIPIKKVLAELAQKLIAIEGKVIAISDTEAMLIEGVYFCNGCGATHKVPIYKRKPTSCDQCGEHYFTLDESLSRHDDVQLFKIQELKADNTGRQTTLACNVQGKSLLWGAKPGEKVKVTGILRLLKYKDRKYERVRSTKQIDVISIEKMQNDALVLSNEDIAKVKKMKDETGIYEKLIESFAPHLYGVNPAKEACLLALASQGLERPLNVGLFGDPDTGKSELMEYSVNLSHNGHLCDMSSASAVGLTAESSYDEETKMRVQNPGTLNYADGGLCGVDEFQGINQEDAKKLNRALESKKINPSKAGAHDELPARCAVVITSNSYFGRWKTSENIYENLKFLGNSKAMIVSRFDLIYILVDTKHKDVDAKKANLIVSTYSEAEIPKTLFMDDTKERYGFITLQKYFAYITKYQKLPSVPKELHDKITSSWLEAREQDHSGVIGNRNLKSIIRLARIIARLLQKESVDEADITRARDLLEQSLDTSAFDPQAGEYDGNFVYGSKKTRRELSKEAQQTEDFEHAYKMALKEGKEKNNVDYAEEKAIIAYMCINSPLRWKESEADHYVQKVLNHSGKYQEIGAGRWRKYE